MTTRNTSRATAAAGSEPRLWARTASSSSKVAAATISARHCQRQSFWAARPIRGQRQVRKKAALALRYPIGNLRVASECRYQLKSDPVPIAITVAIPTSAPAAATGSSARNILPPSSRVAQSPTAKMTA